MLSPVLYLAIAIFSYKSPQHIYRKTHTIFISFDRLFSGAAFVSEQYAVRNLYAGTERDIDEKGVVASKDIKPHSKCNVPCTPEKKYRHLH